MIKKSTIFQEISGVRTPRSAQLRSAETPHSVRGEKSTRRRRKIRTYLGPLTAAFWRFGTPDCAVRADVLSLKAARSRCTIAMVTDTAQARPRRGCWGVKGAPRRLQQRAALPGVHPRHSAVPRGRRQRMGEERSSPTKPTGTYSLSKK